ncbi:MAG: PDZ domain-containing protein, partial [Pseudoflavonifractor sp.]
MKEENRHCRNRALLPARVSALCLTAALLLGAAPAEAASGRAVSAAMPSVSRTVIPMGRAVGIKLFSDGVLVVGLSEIASGAGTQAPAKDCGLREGDIITHINSTEVDTIEEVRDILQTSGEDPLSIRAVRGDKQVQLTTRATQCSTDGSYKLGAWIRDSMAGIGTLTF